MIISTMRKAVIIIAVLFLVFGGFFVVNRRNQQKKAAAEEKTKQAELAAAAVENENVFASGKITAAKQIDLKFQTSGKLAWVGVAEGDYVQQWQAIASLDTTQLKRDLKDALLDYSKDRNDFEETYRVTYREQTPYSAMNNTVKRILEKNQWDLEKAVLAVETEHYDLELATLVTPLAGLVVNIDTPFAGVNITPATAVFTIADPSSLEFVAEVDEVDIVNLHEGQKALITLDSQPEKPLESTIKRIGFSAVKTSGGGTAYEVFLTLPVNENLQFRLGMNGDVEFLP